MIRFRQVFAVTVFASAFVIACGWNPLRPFERESPEVREAISHFDGGDAAIASGILEEYLTTGTCREGSIGTPPRVRARENASFDLGLALFKIAETFGHRFGEEELDASVQDPVLGTQRGEQVACALSITRVIADDPSVAFELRARAYYLEGNLHFLNGNYEQAVTAYDKALELAPGMGDAGPYSITDAGKATVTPDPIGRDTAYNRAIALRRIEDKKDAGQDASSDASEDSGDDAGSGEDSGNQNDDHDAGKDEDSGKKNDDNDAGNEEDSGKKNDPSSDSDAGKEPQSSTLEEDTGAPPTPPAKQSQDERMLDQLENAPTVQQEAARKVGQQRRRVRGMNDK